MAPASKDEPTQTAGGVDVTESDSPDDAQVSTTDGSLPDASATDSATNENAVVTSAPTDDEALQRQIHGSGWPAYQEEARAAAVERVGDAEYAARPLDYWTAQQGGLPQTGQVAALGPQVYAEEQLPDPAIARAAGIPPQNIPAALVVGSLEDAVSHPRGPEPGELVRIAVNRANNERSLEEAGEYPADRELFAHTSSAVQEHRAATSEEDADVERTEPESEPAR